MKVTRRAFVKGGLAAFTVTYAAPEFLCEVARAQGARTRNLVILYLSGGNDSLSMLVPFNDPFYGSRRQGIAVSNVLPVGSDASRVALGLHPRLTGLSADLQSGAARAGSAHGIPQPEPIALSRHRHLVDADPGNPAGFGWLGRYLDSLPSPVDALVGWNTTRDLPRVLQADHVPVPAIPNAAGYTFASPNSNSVAEATAERNAATRIASHVPVNQPELAFVYGSTQAGAGDDRSRASVGALHHAGPVPEYVARPGDEGGRRRDGAWHRHESVLRDDAGFDTHAQQGVNAGSYLTLMATLNDAITAFYTDVQNQGLLDDTLVLSFSEFGRRIESTAAPAPTTAPRSVMFALGGRVNGGLYGTAPNLQPGTTNPTLENNSADVRFETDFRSVYARVVDSWLGATRGRSSTATSGTPP
jgi:uncharacterized protein (DUF1501 family)